MKFEILQHLYIIFEACLGERSNYNNSKDSSLKVKLKTSYPVKDCEQSVDFTDLVVSLIC